jgi:hypothetical protein
MKHKIVPLQQAIECLHIRDVFMHASQASVLDDFDPKYDSGIEDLLIQLKHLVTKSQVIEVNDGDTSLQIFRVFVELGARWVEGAPVEQHDAGEVIPEPKVKAQIEATLVAEYDLKDHPGKDALDAFALKNASYHVWPYWREFLSSQSQRMGLPKVIVPTVQFAHNHNQEPEPSAEADT